MLRLFCINPTNIYIKQCVYSIYHLSYLNTYKL